MIDTILVQGLTLHGKHGALPREAVEAQPFIIDLEMQLDLQPAAASDDLEQTINYAEAARIVQAIIEGPHVALIETLADKIANTLLANLARLDAVQVTVRKPQAPMPFEFEQVAVRITRSRA